MESTSVKNNNRLGRPLLPPQSVPNSSPAEREWMRRKIEYGEESRALDLLMSMVGLEEAKQEFLAVKAIINAAKEWKRVFRCQDFNLVLSGNHGTGERTLASIYRKLLEECEVWPGKVDREARSMFEFQSGGIGLLNSYLKEKHGKSLFLFIDSLEVSQEHFGPNFVRCLERHLPHIDCVTVLAGSTEGVETVFGGLPNARWVFPRRIQLPDYDDDQLHTILLKTIRRNLFEVEGGNSGLYTRIAIQKIGRGRGSAGFANVHELVLGFKEMLRRHAIRYEEAGINQPPDCGRGENGAAAKQLANNDTGHPVLTKEDLIGPEPDDVRNHSVAWKELDKMAGMENVKKALGELSTLAKTNYRRELLGKEPLRMSLNRVFIGPPGTGKTTVAKLYGQAIADLGLLSSGEVVYKTPGDFIGYFGGETEVKTTRILDATLGKVLIIDDAHTFCQAHKDSGETDTDRQACIDIIVSRVHNVPGEDRCVILLGYPDLIEEMFINVNPGLRRRFPLEEAFRFYDYDDKTLNQILRLKMTKEDIIATPQALDVAAEVLRRARDRPNFGNGGDVDNLLNQAKTRFRNRVESQRKTDGSSPDDIAPSTPTASDFTTDQNGEEATAVLEPCDFDPEWDRDTHATTRCQSLFQDLVGFDTITAKFQAYQRMAVNLRRRGKDPRETIPLTFVFKGPPGTGKTHTARILGQIFYNMGFLSSSEVVECSVSNLIGEYKGQSAPKVVAMFERALGKVLFIDEAYRLAGRGSYEEEVVGELVDCMTKQRYHRKLVIVLAGYERDMDHLMRKNEGLRGRFTTDVVFPPMDPPRMSELLRKRLREEDIEVRDTSNTGSKRAKTLGLFEQLSATAGWSNGRDIQTLAGMITGNVYECATLEELSGKDQERLLEVSTAKVNGFLENMLQERKRAGQKV